MRVPRPRTSPPPRLRLPRRTARLRLTALYGGVCLVFGAFLLTVTYLLTSGALVAQAVPRPASGSGVGSAQQQSQGSFQNGTEQVTVDRRVLLTRSGIALAIVSVAAVGAGWLLAGRVLRPLSTITAAARRISASSLHERLALHGPDDELKELGDTLDDLFARLEAGGGLAIDVAFPHLRWCHAPGVSAAVGDGDRLRAGAGRPARRGEFRV